MIDETLDGLAGQTENLNKIKGFREHQFNLISRELGAVRALSEKITIRRHSCWAWSVRPRRYPAMCLRTFLILLNSSRSKMN